MQAVSCGRKTVCWDFHPLTGKPPGGYDDGVATYKVDVREDGVYVGLPEDELHVETVSDVMAKTLVNWGVRWVWGIGRRREGCPVEPARPPLQQARRTGQPGVQERDPEPGRVPPHLP